MDFFLHYIIHKFVLENIYDREDRIVEYMLSFIIADSFNSSLLNIIPKECELII